jgi:hypothetical protein
MAHARRILLAAAVALSAGPAPAQPQPAAVQTGASDEDGDSSNAIVVTGYRDIVVNGRARRCRPTPGDPLDSVSVPAPSDHTMIVPDERGGFVARPANERITGPEFWQRVGIDIGAYRFRAPSDGTPMCIGGRNVPQGFAGFRRIVDAAPYRGRRAPFTAWVATGRARQVNFWLATGTVVKGGPLLNGGNTNNVPFGGNNDWTPVLLETGPIHEDARHISYGFNLEGSGDVWVYDARLEIVASDPGDARTGDRIVIGYRPR